MNYNICLLYLFINKLPYEINEIIRRMSYKVQPIKLLNSITSFYNQRKSEYLIYGDWFWGKNNEIKLIPISLLLIYSNLSNKYKILKDK